MSIIIQTGHHSSKSKLLMQKLYESGLSRPLNSHNHKLAPQEVAGAIYKILSRKDVSIQHNKLSDNLMVDLLLSNLDFESWGWESEENLLALDHWYQLDSNTRFILVFDHPNNLVSKITSGLITVDKIDKIINDWINYHKKMLDFSENNKGKAILVEGAHAVNNIKDTCKEIESVFQNIHLGHDLHLANTSVISNTNTVPDYELKAIKDYLFASILCEYPEIIKVFNNLLNKSSISHSNSILKTKKTNTINLIATLNYVSRYNEFNKIQDTNNNKILTERVEELNKEKHKIESEFSEIKKLLENAKKDIKKLESKKETNETYISNNRKLKQENEMLISQLHYVQEELERILLKKEDIGYSGNKILSDSVINPPVYYGAAERVKQDLPYRLGATMIKQGKSAKGLAVLPLSLAKEYKNFKREQSDLNISPRLEDYQDTYEADRVRSHLSYQLGNTLVEGLGHPLRAVKIPYKSFKHILDFKKK